MSGLVVSDVLYNSPAYKGGILAGDNILSINGTEIRDIIDYLYFQTDDYLLFNILSKDGTYKKKYVKNPYNKDIGLIFTNGLIKKIFCKNKCPFCFVDQLPKGLRRNLYIKDDDWRLSFLTGSYITLTNLSKKDIHRIIEKHISPLYISIHAWDNVIRSHLMGTEEACDVIKKIKYMINNGIIFHAQVVLCPGINDGKILYETINEMINLYPGISSLAIVPVGLTKFRENLVKLKEVDKISANNAIEIIKEYQEIALKNFGKRFVYASDELFIKANLKLPNLKDYDDLDQLENGVGLIAKFNAEALDALKKIKYANNRLKSYALVTGTDFFPYLLDIAIKIKKQYGIILKVYEIKNNFFGDSITVSGLLTGTDIISSLKGKVKEDILLISKTCLRDGDNIFLDDISLDYLSKSLNIICLAVEPNGYALINVITKGEIGR